MDNCICIEPDGYSEFERLSYYTAKKSHICCECRETIPIGQKYEYSVCKFDGNFDTSKTCMTCVRIRKEYFPCGWYQGEIWADIHENKCLIENDGFCMCPPKARKISCWR